MQQAHPLRHEEMIGETKSRRLKIVHMSSAHRADDSRIFWKECVSLAGAGYDVSFVVPDDGSRRREGGPDGTEIIPVRRPVSRFARILVATSRVVGAALRENAAIYHFHDPELIPGGLVLRALGRRVIYDAHEDLPRDILFKDWIPRRWRWPVSQAASTLEWLAGRAFSGTVATTPTIAARFPTDRVVLVQNFARLREFVDDEPPTDAERGAIAYIGAVTPERCAVEMVEAIGRVERFPEIRLIVGGEMSPSWLGARLAATTGWQRVEYRGRQDRAGVRRMLREARAGLAIFHPVQSYVESQPVKLFEYMAAGLPVIAADFPKFREIVEGNGCGICVPPLDTAAVAAAIEWIFANPAEADAMGRRGRALVLRSYNWEREFESLLRLYDRVLGRAVAAEPGISPVGRAEP